MTRKETINIIKVYFATYPVSKVGLFGSFAREDERPDSDIDILISLKIPIDLLTLAKMTRELKELLGRPVDIVTEKSLLPKMRASVAKDLKIILAA